MSTRPIALKAWYQVGNGGYKRVGSEQSITAKKDYSVGDYRVTVTVASTDHSLVELTNGSGATKYWANGHEVTKNDGKAYGEFTVSAAWTATDAPSYTAPADDVKDANINTTFTAVLSGKGNVVLLTTNNAASAVSSPGTITITFKLTARNQFTAQTGTNYTVDGNNATGYFAVRTNNEAGPN